MQLASLCKVHSYRTYFLLQLLQGDLAIAYKLEKLQNVITCKMLQPDLAIGCKPVFCFKAKDYAVDLAKILPGDP